MISARSEVARNQVLPSWNEENVTVIDTVNISINARERLVHHPCKESKRMNRPYVIFSAYQQVFKDILHFNSDTFFVFVEDDALLLDSKEFRNEICMAKHNEFQFYSLWDAPANHRTCFYYYSTTAFIISRMYMEKLSTD